MRLKVIKDAIRPAFDDGPQLTILRPGFLPLSLHVLIDMPLQGSPDTSTALRLAGWPGDASSSAEFRATAFLPPATAALPCRRRMLLTLICPEAPPGRYRLSLLADGRERAAANVARRVERVRVLDRSSQLDSHRPMPVLISGTPKSGTTWLEAIVNAHPDMLVLHEANTLRLLDADRLSAELGDRREYYATRHIPWMPDAYAPADLARFLQVAMAKSVMDSLGRAWGARYVADRTPGYADLYPYLEDVWEEVRVLHAVRHPLDVMASWLFHEAKAGRDPARKLRLPRSTIDTLNARLDTEQVIQPGNFVTDMALQEGAFSALARTWKRQQLAFLQAAANAPHQFQLVRYEQLSADFPAAAGRIFAFLATDPERTDLPAIEQATSFRALSGGREPGQGEPRSFFRKGVVGDWRHIFSPMQAELIWAELAETAASFGYAMA